MSNIVKLSDRKKAKEQQAKKAAADQRARQNGSTGGSTRAKLPLLILSVLIVLLGIFWEPVLHFLAALLGRG
jgi:hypothetical protein